VVSAVLLLWVGVAVLVEMLSMQASKLLLLLLLL
jgi:hypothetical protein